MNVKILSVDDSKAVRIIIKRSFKEHAVDVIEAANGVEGLAAAAKERPDLILLDVTMPVMDGVEMLTKLKADPTLKSIPVIMLTAEAGRENVMKIAKIGIRDYIIKPFKENVLVDKVGRIIEIKPKQTAGGTTPGAGNASQTGSESNCFMSNEDALLVQLPTGCADDLLQSLETSIAGKISDAVDNGLYRVIFDLSKIEALNEKIVNLVAVGIKHCQELTLSHTIVGSPELAAQGNGFEVSKDWAFTSSLEEAKIG